MIETEKGVLQICNYSASYKGNFISSLERLAERFAGYGLEQIYLFPQRAASSGAVKWIQEMRSRGVSIYIQSGSVKENAALLKKIVKEHNIQLVFRHFNDPQTDVLIKLLLPEIPVIRFFHCMYKGAGLKHQMRKILYKKDVLVGVSDAVTEDIKKVFTGNEVICVENAICFDRLDRTDAFDRSDKISFLTMGYNYQAKGVDLTLKAMKELSEEYDFVLRIAVASHRDKLDEEIKNCFGDEIPSWLELLEPSENIGTYYRNSDIFLTPSRFEGFCYAIPESAYCGDCIAASDIPAQKAMRIDGIFYFRSGDIEDYKEAIKKAMASLDNPQEKETRIRNIEKVQQEYSIDKWCDKIIDITTKIGLT